jgi:hypothetical protein
MRANCAKFLISIMLNKISQLIENQYFALILGKNTGG